MGQDGAKCHVALSRWRQLIYLAHFLEVFRETFFYEHNVCVDFLASTVVVVVAIAAAAA